MSPPTHTMSSLSQKDRLLVRIYMAGCLHYWDQLPPLAQQFYSQAGGTLIELRACIRHLVVLAGYGPCLAATLTLHKAKLLPEDTPAKCGGPPGNAFELVYTSVTDAVRKKCHNADPGLGEWIRMHLYGDVYSSPGLDLRCKQLLMCAALAEADMGEQLYGHALAGLRFGNRIEQLEEAVKIAFEMTPRPRPKLLEQALHTLTLSKAKLEKDSGGGGSGGEYDYAGAIVPEVDIKEAEEHVRIPPLPPLFNLVDKEKGSKEGGGGGSGRLTGDGGATFLWDKLAIAAQRKV